MTCLIDRVLSGAGMEWQTYFYVGDDVFCKYLGTMYADFQEKIVKKSGHMSTARQLWMATTVSVGGHCNCEFAKCIGRSREKQRTFRSVRAHARRARARAFITLKKQVRLCNVSRHTIMSVSINNGLSTVNNVS